jgi:hypothetical protein
LPRLPTAQLGDLSKQALEQFKIRVLDAIGVAIAAPTRRRSSPSARRAWRPPRCNAHRRGQDQSLIRKPRNGIGEFHGRTILS